MQTKRFPLRVLLTVTTGRLLTEPRDGGNGIEALYEILGWMTDDSPCTHQLPRLAEECKPWLLRWFPELGPAGAALDKLDGWIADSCDGPETGVLLWLTEVKMLFPALRNEYDVPRIPADDHERKDPYDELVQMRGTDEGIIIVDGT